MRNSLINVHLTKSRISFNDDDSEWDGLSNWGDGPEWLSLSDHRLSPEGLQARRTVGEALLQAKPELRSGWYQNALCWRGVDRCRFGGGNLVFSWAEVTNLCLVPTESRAPSYLIAVSTVGIRDTLAREWLLQAANARDRAFFCLEMGLKIATARAQRQGHVGCGTVSCGRQGLSIALSTDLARVACEAARCRPSQTALQNLTNLLRLLTDSEGSSINQCCAGGFPLAGLQRFGVVVEEAVMHFDEWRRFREVALLVQAPHEIDAAVWKNHLMKFLWPKEPSLRDLTTDVYPVAIEEKLSGAAKRCYKTLC